ncbi:RNA polymerase sigma factor [Aliarcobacter butzleri]|uniref:RNA polymerase sigma factor n=1 Tax=Aliarcobacter butzleri TaxID=28197 RepID=UPI00384FC7C1
MVQETYEKVISIKNSKEIENERALLYKVAKNIIIDRLRKNKNYKEISYEEENFISQYKAPEDLAIEQNQQDILMKELKKLPPKRKEAFVLHILEGYTKEEMLQPIYSDSLPE